MLKEAENQAPWTQRSKHNDSYRTTTTTYRSTKETPFGLNQNERSMLGPTKISSRRRHKSKHSIDPYRKTYSARGLKRQEGYGSSDEGDREPLLSGERHDKRPK